MAAVTPPTDIPQYDPETKPPIYTIEIGQQHYVGADFFRKNRRTPHQQSHRTMLGFLSNYWASLTDAQKASWSPANAPNYSTNRQAFIGHNLWAWQQGDDPTKSLPRPDPGDPPSVITDWTINADVHLITTTYQTSGIADTWLIITGHRKGAPPVLNHVGADSNLQFSTPANFVTVKYLVNEPGTWHTAARLIDASGRQTSPTVNQSVITT